MSPRVLRAENLCVETRRGAEAVPLVADASFEMRTGEVLALVGTSGSGKSLACGCQDGRTRLFSLPGALAGQTEDLFATLGVPLSIPIGKEEAMALGDVIK